MESETTQVLAEKKPANQSRGYCNYIRCAGDCHEKEDEEDIGLRDERIVACNH
jgi:hypothetical protein